jgi:hypothetical protein
MQAGTVGLLQPANNCFAVARSESSEFLSFCIDLGDLVIVLGRIDP